MMKSADFPLALDKYVSSTNKWKEGIMRCELDQCRGK